MEARFKARTAIAPETGPASRVSSGLGGGVCDSKGQAGPDSPGFREKC